MFLVDDLDGVFGLPADQGVPILRDLITIGDLDGARTLLAYVTGNSSRIRRLCFTKLEAHEAAILPSYMPTNDFNFRMYDAITLDPIATRLELTGAIERVGLTGGGVADDTTSPGSGTIGSMGACVSSDKALRDLFLQSRGIAQALVDWGRPFTSPNNSLINDFNNVKYTDAVLATVWRALLDATKSTLGTAAFTRLLDMLAAGVFTVELPWVNSDQLQGAAEAAGKQVDTAVLWDYADMGFLRVQADSVAETAPLNIRFAHASDLWWAVHYLAQRRLKATANINAAAVAMQPHQAVACRSEHTC